MSVDVKSRVRAALPASAFQKSPMRLVLGLGALATNSLLIVAAAKLIGGKFLLGLPAVLFVAVVGVLVGHLNAIMSFVSHEILHNAVISGRRRQDLFAFVLFSPFQMSPTFWRYWHNFLHHKHTQNSIRDPDAYPRYAHYKSSRVYQRLYSLAPGSGTLMSYFYLFYWFSFQTIWNQSVRRFREQHWRKLNHKRVSLEFGVQLVLMGGFVVAVWLYLGWLGIFGLVVVPFLIQNYLLMSYIATNHNLSPQTRENNPLENSMSVKSHVVFEFLHGNFGYHVEHHLFPSMNPWSLNLVHDVLSREKGYRCMEKWRAMRLLYVTPRIYKDRETLIDPKSRREVPLADLH